MLLFRAHRFASIDTNPMHSQALPHDIACDEYGRGAQILVAHGAARHMSCQRHCAKCAVEVTIPVVHGRRKAQLDIQTQK